MDKKKFMKVISIITALILSVSLFGCSKKADDMASKSVSTENTSEVLDDYSNALSGKVKPASDIDIISKVSGRIASINLKEGQPVKAGDVLFTLEDKDIKLQVNQAEAALNYARSNYAKVTGSAVDKQNNQNLSALNLAEAEYNNAEAALKEERQKDAPYTSVKSAEVKLQDAQSNLDKKQQLFTIDGISQRELDLAKNELNYAQDQLNSANTTYNNAKIVQQQALDTAVTRVQKAEEALRAAREQQNTIQSKTNQDDANMVLAQLKQAEAAYETAKAQLDNTVYRSPDSGIISAKNVEVGEMISTTTVIAKIVDLASVTVEVNVQEIMVNKMQVGDKVKVLVKSADSIPFEGEITSVDPVADVKSQSYPVKIKVNNDNGLLKGDMFAEVLFSN